MLLSPPAKTKFFTEAQVQTLLSLPGLSVRDRAILQVLVHTGLRASELVALNLGDVDLAAGILVVRSGKGGKARFVGLAPPVIPHLSRLLSRSRSPLRPVFVNVWGGRLTRQGLHRIVKGHLRRAGLSGSLHTLRHTAATRWVNHGVPLRTVQAQLGHVRAETTSQYVGLATESLAAQMRASFPA